MINLVDVVTLDNMKLQLTYSNGVSGIIDCSPKNPQSVFNRFSDRSFFDQVKIIRNNLIWDDEVDYDGMSAYYKITGFNPYETQMVQISQFCGIIISMFFGDHNPPHFHAEYAEFEASFRISDGGLMKGKLPPKIHGLVLERRTIHHEELSVCWQKAVDEGIAPKIAPLQ